MNAKCSNRMLTAVVARRCGRCFKKRGAGRSAQFEGWKRGIDTRVETIAANKPPTVPVGLARPKLLKTTDGCD